MSVATVSPVHVLDSSAGCRVLVVEDDEICRDIMVLMLDRLGYHTDVASDGMDALSALHAEPFDVVLMDVRMPRMDGMEAARLIRAELDSADQPTIVAMSADTTPRCREECLQAGMDGHLSKPVRIDDLAAALENRLLRQWKLEALDPANPDDRPVPATSPTVVYDPAVLEALIADLGAEGSLRIELIESFIHDCQERLTAVVMAGDAADLGALAFQAHALKSASATIGLPALSDVAHEIEAAATANPVGVDVGSQALCLAAECERAIDALHAALLAEPG
ncbi:MAG: response regulator [Acidimicrobiales bacterium]|jgi:CheY-like chemotaxis protein/HPt (histidine-containing phosphotransfer) domain-containing protein